MWRSLRTRDEVEARQLLKEFDQERWRKTCFPVSSFFEDFLNCAALNFREKTVTMYAQCFKNFQRICGDIRLSKVVPLDGEKFKQQRAREVSAVSVNIELRSLRAAFNEARRLKLIEENPFEGIKPVRVPWKEASYLSELEFSKLLSAIEDYEFRDLVKFSTLTLLRLGEVSSLRWDAISLERKEIRIQSNGRWEVKGRSSRAVPMNDWVHTFLASKLRTSEFVFSRNGKQLSSSTVSHRFKRYVRKTGLSERIHFHSLRHTGISWLINRGVPLPFIQRIAGHSSPIVTDIYTHVQDKNLLTAINAFGPVMTN